MPKPSSPPGSDKGDGHEARLAVDGPGAGRQWPPLRQRRCISNTAKAATASSAWAAWRRPCCRKAWSAAKLAELLATVRDGRPPRKCKALPTG